MQEERTRYQRVIMVARQKMRDGKMFEAYDLLGKILEDMEAKNGQKDENKESD